MADFGLIISGSVVARQVLQAYADAAREHASTVGYSVVADVPYAAGIETGRRRNGRVARKLGGLHFMRSAVEQITHSGSVQDAIGSLPNTPDALRGVRQRVANAVAERARHIITPFPYSPSTKRPTGGLARSIHVVHGGQGTVLTAPLVPAVGRTRATVSLA